MTANRDKLFFAYLALYDVHTPLMAREDLRKKYEEKRRALGTSTQWGREEPRDVRLTQDHAVYAAMVDAMDQAVGRVLRKIDDLGLRENTLVIFTSDNGGLSTSEGWPTSNLPLRAGKGWIYEGGIREPLIVRWPAAASPGRVVDTPVYSPDFMPTLLEAAWTQLPGRSDGRSLLPLLRGEALPERALFWHYPHYGNQGGAPAAAIRRGDWKLIEWLEDGRVELFHLAADLGEQHDLAAREPDRVAALRAELHAWQQSVGAIQPTPNPAYDPAKPNGRHAARAGSARPAPARSP